MLFSDSLPLARSAALDYNLHRPLCSYLSFPLIYSLSFFAFLRFLACLLSPLIPCYHEQHLPASSNPSGAIASVHSQLPTPRTKGTVFLFLPTLLSSHHFALHWFHSPACTLGPASATNSMPKLTQRDSLTAIFTSEMEILVVFRHYNAKSSSLQTKGSLSFACLSGQRVTRRLFDAVHTKGLSCSPSSRQSIKAGSFCFPPLPLPLPASRFFSSSTSITS